MIERIRHLLRTVAEAMSGDQPGTEAPPEIDPRREQYVSPEERILAELTGRGGVSPQGELQSATGWSAAKTSRVLSAMEDERSIDRYELGRQKVVCLPDEEPPHLTDVEGNE